MAEFLVGFFVIAGMASPRLRRMIRVAKMKKEAGYSFDSSRAKAYMNPFEDPMSLREATLILGVRETVGKEKIIAAHKRLMLLNHPDNGGSTYIALKVNQAKEVILERI